MGKCVASVETHGLTNDALGASADSVSERAFGGAAKPYFENRVWRR